MDTKKTNGSGNGHGSANAGNAANEWRVKVGLAEMLKGGVIMDVTNAEQAKIAEKAGACAVMALERRLGAEAVFVGSGIFKSSDPDTRAKAVVKAATHFEDAKAVLEAHEELGEAMKGIDVRQLEEKDLLSTRGW